MPEALQRSLMTRVLLVLPTATYRAADFLSAASALGVEVVLASDQPQAMSEAMGGRALHVDLDRPEATASAIVELASRLPLDAVVGVDDQGVLPAALAAERLGLPHNPPAAAALTRDKAAMRAALARAGVAQPAYAVLEQGHDAAAKARGLGFPVVVKPTGLAASQGVIRADDPATAAQAEARVRAILGAEGRPSAEPLLLERYVPGEEVAVEGLLSGGALSVLAVFDKPDPLEGPYFEETIYVTPSRHPPEVTEAVAHVTASACAALGLSEGPVHAELRLPPDQMSPGQTAPGQTGVPAPGAVLLEVAARSIGGLCSRTLSFGTGLSLERVILAHALGLPPTDLTPTTEAAGVMMLPIPASGVLRAIKGQEEARAVQGIVGLELSIALGRTVQALPEGNRYLGFLLARGPTPAEVEGSLRAAHARLEVVVEPLAPAR
ncbi:MAG: ATP-grasp domain-containing protein [Acidimicrobiales bacterium]|nr:ATP-grasp domain-containing protein [Acidimicrobiales bacterium]